jgi:hypothetical protein
MAMAMVEWEKDGTVAIISNYRKIILHYIKENL